MSSGESGGEESNCEECPDREISTRHCLSDVTTRRCAFGRGLWAHGVRSRYNDLQDRLRGIKTKEINLSASVRLTCSKNLLHDSMLPQQWTLAIHFILRKLRLLKSQDARYSKSSNATWNAGRLQIV